jgi:hypothetical protein
VPWLLATRGYEKDTELFTRKAAALAPVLMSPSVVVPLDPNAALLDAITVPALMTVPPV